MLIPSFNHARYLRQCLESVRSQTLADWTAIVADDASGDGSAEVAESIADDRIRVIRRTRNQGLVANENQLLGETGAEYVAILHSDDWWEPEFLATMVDLLDGAPSALIANCAHRVVRQQGPAEVDGFCVLWGRSGLCQSRQALPMMLTGCRLAFASVLARSELYSRFSFDATMPELHDWHMWIRAAEHGDIAVTAEVLANFRVHERSETSRLRSANLVALDYIRLAKLLSDSWAGAEPYAGAVRQLRTSAWIHVIGEAWRFACAGDAAAAMLDCRLATGVAPSITTRAATSAFGLAVATRAVGLLGPRMAPLDRIAHRLGDQLRTRSAPSLAGWRHPGIR